MLYYHHVRIPKGHYFLVSRLYGMNRSYPWRCPNTAPGNRFFTGRIDRYCCMARPRKIGLDYFPFDVNLDDQFRALEELHGNDGFVWLVKFWQSAYRTEDGIVDLSDIRGVLGAKTSRISTDKQSEIIRDCIKLGLLMELEPYKYTSHGIKKRLTRVRGEREYDRNYTKIELSDRKPTDNLPITGEIKQNKTKLNKIKENENNDNIHGDIGVHVPFEVDTEKPPEINPDYRACSELLKKRVQECRQAKIDETKLRAWDTDVRLMVERDKRSTEQIRAIITECHDMQPRPGSGFTWRDQILSMSTLRRQWNDGKIFIGMNKKPKEEDDEARWAFLEKTVETKK